MNAPARANFPQKNECKDNPFFQAIELYSPFFWQLGQKVINNYTTKVINIKFTAQTIKACAVNH